jgi:gas vesicle protein
MKLWIGLLAGFAAGITVGILYAPARGTVTRRRIAQTAGDLADTSREKMHDISRAAKRKARCVSKMANEKVHQASDFAREKADDIGEAVEAVREKLQRVTA